MGHFIYAEDLICVQGGKETLILYLLKTDPLNLCFQLKLIPRSSETLSHPFP